MLEILARIRGIWQSAKLCHWMCTGNNFAGDHELFDRIFKEFHGDSDDFVDSLTELYYMNENRDNIHDLNKLATFTTEYILEVSSSAEGGMMANNLYILISQLRALLNTDEYSQGIKAKFDEIAAVCDLTMGLLLARFTIKNEGCSSRSAINKMLFE